MPLLSTKLRAPAPRRGLVARARLVDRLVDPTTLPLLVLVSAPAGFGKTTLLTQWLTAARERAGQGLRVGWLSLDDSDNDVRAFLSHLLAALQASCPEVGSDALVLLATDRGLPVEDVV